HPYLVLSELPLHHAGFDRSSRQGVRGPGGIQRHPVRDRLPAAIRLAAGRNRRDLCPGGHLSRLGISTTRAGQLSKTIPCTTFAAASLVDAAVFQGILPC